MIHLQGMGVIGCYLAWRLWEDGVPFTWDDRDSNVVAWRACTGAIFPTGHPDDLRALETWRGHFDAGQGLGFAAHMEEAAYVFCTKAAPHKGRYPWAALGGGLKIASPTSLHLNAQRWVPFTRSLFEPSRRDAQEPGSKLVITHGFGPRLGRYMWGWTVPVRVACTADFGAYRGCFYFRRGRFEMAYAYPIPGTGLWYAGSSLISQQVPRELDVPPKFERWREQFLRLGNGFITDVEVADDPLTGWRPVPFKVDEYPLVAPLRDGSGYAVKPLWHSGVRHAPLVYDALKEALSANTNRRTA